MDSQRTPTGNIFMSVTRIVPGKFCDARFQSGFAIRILAFAIDTAHQITIAFRFFRHEPVHSPHSEHWVDDFVVQQLRQFFFDFLGRQMLQTQSFALAQSENFLEKRNTHTSSIRPTPRSIRRTHTCKYAMAGLMYVAEFTLRPNCLLNTASARKLSDSAGLA